MNYHRWFFLARDPENIGCVSIVHPWESGRDNCPDWDLGLKNIKERAAVILYMNENSDNPLPLN